jgi:tellurite resistance protein
MESSRFKIVHEGLDTMSLVLSQFERIDLILSGILKDNPKAEELRDPKFLFYQGLQNSLALVAQYHDQIEMHWKSMNRMRMINKILEDENKELREIVNRNMAAEEIDITKATITWKQAMKNKIKQMNEFNNMKNARTGN